MSRLDLNWKKMEDQFVPYELSVKLRDAGIDMPCIGYYYGFNLFIGDRFSGVDKLYKNMKGIKAPLWQQAFDWFMVNHGYSVNFISPYQGNYDGFIEYYSHTHTLIQSKSLIETKEKALTKLIELYHERTRGT